MAEELAKIHEYSMYKELMKEVRELEGYITIWQNELRENIQNRQLTEYIEIGDEKLKEFFTNWEQKFSDFEQNSLDKMEELKTRAEQEVEELNLRLDQSIKVKPSAKLKEMQCQEKLVAINERIEEAQNYRKELKDFEVAESWRVQKEREQTTEKERQKLIDFFKKEMKQLEAKIETQRHNLKIKMDKELNRLQKEINLHVNDIKRIQGLITRLSKKKGETQDELRRVKDRSRKTMVQLKEQKKIQAGQWTRTSKQGTLAAAGSTILGEGDLLFSGLQNPSMMSSFGQTTGGRTNYMSDILPLKLILDQRPLTDFQISATSGNKKKPVNEPGDQTESKLELHGKIKSLLDQRKPPTESLPSLCDMYDDDLNPI